ncbi:MAG: hypothetical protein K2X77_01735 [Candidatus Obscuribacterales bacterium]|nr:hypothetical protein [Candidatus Obscuribacterales bacterium]
MTQELDPRTVDMAETKSAESTAAEQSSAKLFEDSYFDLTSASRMKHGAQKDVDHIDLSNPFAKEPDDEWTVVVNLTADMSLPDRQNGSAAEFESLKQLADETRDKPISIIVQKTSATENNEQKLERYILEDGRIESLPDADSVSAAADLESLILTAVQETESKKIALINQSHGMGEDGITGDSGAASLEEIGNSIHNGLEGSEHTKLDVLDFDACSMGTDAVASAMQECTDYVVASSEKEHGEIDGLFDAQDLKSNIQRLLEDPTMDPSEFADAMVEQARVDSTKVSENGISGVDTLAKYDLKDYARFQSDLNTLGNTLAESSLNPANKEEIERIIAALPAFGEFNTKLNYECDQKRDLKMFCDRLSDAIKSGRLSDENGKLETAIQKVNASHSELVENFHGSRIRAYDQMGGLSVFLPELSFLDTSEGAEKSTALYRLDLSLDTLDQSRTISRTMSTLATMTKLVENELTQDESKVLQTAWQRLESAAAKESSDTTLRSCRNETRESMSDFKQLIESLMQSKNTAIADRLYKDGIQKQKEAALKTNLNPVNSGWNKFIQVLDS